MLSSRFPMYADFDPKVPVWCVTPERMGCMHRFFDTSPISPSGRYLAVFAMPFEDRRPGPGEYGQIVVVDLETGDDQVVAETCGWESQLGANLNWGGSDEELYFNDVDTSSWQPFAWKLNPLSGEKMKMQGCVYHASPDGRYLIASNMTTTCRTQPGYGVVIPQEKVRCNVGAVEDDGFYLTDTATGECKLLVSIRDLFTKANPAIGIDDPEKYEIYGFHSKFNPQGDRLMLSLRWYAAEQQPTFDAFGMRKHVDFAWVTMKLDGSEMHGAVGPEEWVKGGHHATWFPDGWRISMNLNIDGEARKNDWTKLRFVQVNADGTGYGKMLDSVLGSGHPTVHPDGRHLLADTYTWELAAFGDGTMPLRWIDLQTGHEECVVRMNTAHPYGDQVLRIDPHPAWDRSWRYVTFNGFVEGSRRVFIADMQSLIEG